MRFALQENVGNNYWNETQIEREVGCWAKMSALVKSENKVEGHQNIPSTVSEAHICMVLEGCPKILFLNVKYFMKCTDLS